MLMIILKYQQLELYMDVILAIFNEYRISKSSYLHLYL